MTGGVFMLFTLVMYLASAYDDIFDCRLAYLYDPASDDIYAIELAPMLSAPNKWDVFIPFKSLHYTEPDLAEYLGKLQREIDNFQADKELLESDLDAWFEKERQEIRQRSSKETTEITLCNIEYFRHPLRDIATYVSETLPQILQSRKNQVPLEDISVVDAVVATQHIVISRIQSKSKFIDKPWSLKLVNKALLFTGTAASMLNESGFSVGLPSAHPGGG